MRSFILLLISFEFAFAAPSGAWAQRSRSGPAAKTTAAKQSEASTTSSIEGDVYLVTESGDVKRAAANVVHLVPADSLNAIRTAECQRPRLVSDSLLRLEHSADSMETAYVLNSTGKTADDFRAILDAKARIQSARDDIERRAAVAVRQRLSRAVVRDARTGMDAHYRIDSLPPGAYALWAETVLADNFYQWLTTVDVPYGGHQRIDLDNSVLTQGGGAYCGFPAKSYWFRP